MGCRRLLCFLATAIAYMEVQGFLRSSVLKRGDLRILLLYSTAVMTCWAYRGAKIWDAKGMLRHPILPLRTFRRGLTRRQVRKPLTLQRPAAFPCSTPSEEDAPCPLSRAPAAWGATSSPTNGA